MNRRGRIGGSDIASVLNLEPYGCARRLWYEKTGRTPDRERRTTGIMETGTVMEAFIADRVSEQTGWKLRNKATITGAEHEAANIDRHIVAFDERGPGVLEIKCIGRQTYWNWFHEGVALGYVLQLQWYMYLTGWEWGVIAAWNREHDGDGSVKLYPFEYDDALMVQVSESVDRFWNAVTENQQPPVLDPRDDRCAGCHYAATCKAEEWANVGGEHQRDDLIQIAAAYDEARGMAAEADEIKEQARRRLMEAIGDAAVAYAGDWKISAKPQTAKRVDVEALKARFPEVYKEVAVASMSRPLRVTTSNKERTK